MDAFFPEHLLTGKEVCKLMSIDRTFFDPVYDRRNTGAIKYDGCSPTESECVIPMWIADMHFKVPPAVEQELLERVRHGIFGYTDTGADYDGLVAAWYGKRFRWTIDGDWILKTPGVIFAVAAAIHALSKPGDGVLICQPVYYPFAKIIAANGRRAVGSELILKNGRYEIDFADFEQKIRTNAVRIFLLCSPHNPVSRVWTRAELEEIGRICEKYNVYIVSDEIHSDFVFADRPHIPISTLSEALAQRTVTCTSPTKTFNLAGLQAANIIIPNGQVRRQVYRECRATGYSHLNTMAIAATGAAYRFGEPWLDALLAYLRESYGILKRAFPRGGPISLIEPEGTYLAWLDCRGLGMTDDELAGFFRDRAHVRLHLGAAFGPGGSGFVRMNIACPHAILLKAVSQIQNALQ